MKIRSLNMIVLGILCFSLNQLWAAEIQPTEYVVLCYHNIPQKVEVDDPYGVSQNMFVEHLEYLKTHGYNPVSVSDILAAAKGGKKLPEKAVLLTFDDAYVSFYDFVFPVLERFGYPGMLAVVGSWIDNGPPEGLPESLMTWDQIREVSKSDLIEVASHSYDLHREVQYNVPGNVGSVVSVPEYIPGMSRYETEKEYEKKLDQDFKNQLAVFKREIGKFPRIMVWPYGRYNQVGTDVAKKNGFQLAFTLGEGGDQYEINRFLIGNEPITSFISNLKDPKTIYPIRAVQVDLDLIYDPGSYEQTDKNLGLLIDRLYELKANTVYLQAFSDPDGDGNIEKVYFDNRVLPVEKDMFSHAVHQIMIRGFRVYAWMPTLSIVFPDEEFNENYRVREYHEGKIRPSKSWYKRLTPFSPEVREKVQMLYEDLGARAQVNGILFQDDAYLTDREDFHPLALESFSRKEGRQVVPEDIFNDPSLADRWTAHKTQTLIDFTLELEKGVLKYRPFADSARNLYARVLINPRSEFWFAQSYDQFLEAYDQVVVMAYPKMEKEKKSLPWLKNLTHEALKNPLAKQKTIFKLQAYDWNKNEWIDDDDLLKEMRVILSSGGRHLAYYPDNVWSNKPNIDIIKLEMSTRTLPGIKEEKYDKDFSAY